eukprot:scaffold285_cov304-Pinguiococcus_pyrenoidosus.AAC.10
MGVRTGFRSEHHEASNSSLRRFDAAVLFASSSPPILQQNSLTDMVARKMDAMTAAPATSARMKNLCRPQELQVHRTSGGPSDPKRQRVRRPERNFPVLQSVKNIFGGRVLRYRYFSSWLLAIGQQAISLCDRFRSPRKRDCKTPEHSYAGQPVFVSEKLHK